MATNVDQVAARYPPPPAGYEPAEAFEYPKRRLQVTANLLLVASVPLWLWIGWWLPGEFRALPLRGLGDLLLVLATVLLGVLVHEAVHGLAYRLLGYRVTFGANLRLFAAYAAAFGQFQKRNHNLVVALAPLLVITAVMVPLLAAPDHTVSLVALAMLLFNTGGAVGDLYLAWRLLRWPAAALLYDVNPKTMLVYLPAGR
ncbi:MAG: DUF3267 domain-containing protein [Chloroflexi bacterium]|nr:DUF3267 domain-containing protein [Chloroflexota bacterium]MCI0576676.1 DUF3267 domain-containing protein [Chloroflexota bacterium]MCI0647989.1 DUF3267 domain-containing protein [Chloroflexota bacterium]MCI0726801.1 DUF3267 domain-containing protein [Chloroflexota bacterium]